MSLLSRSPWEFNLNSENGARERETLNKCFILILLISEKHTANNVKLSIDYYINMLSLRFERIVEEGGRNRGKLFQQAENKSKSKRI